MIDREKVIGLLQEVAEYFRECRNNVSFASKAENHYWELQNAANEAVELLKKDEQITVSATWISHLYRFGSKAYECSLCHGKSWRPSTYCPDCGTRMTKVVNMDD